MKIMLVGSDKIFAIENFYAKYLRASGVEVIHFSVQTLFYDYHSRSLVNRVLHRLGLSKIYQTINEKFKALVESKRPDVIWIFKGMEIFPDSLAWVRAKNVKLVNYNPDNPFIFLGRGSGNQNITDSIGLYDLHFTYNLSIQKELIARFNARTALLPFGFELSDELFRKCQEEEEVLRTCFLGNPDKHRAAFILTLANAGVEISVYGHHWDRFISQPLVKICHPVYSEAQWKVLRRYRVQLNLMRIHNEDSHNMRTFEIPAIGAIMVAPNTTEHRMFFADGKEAFFFDNAADCVRIIKELMLVSAEKSNEIRNAARNRSVNAGYSYKNRTESALLQLKKLAGE